MYRCQTTDMDLIELARTYQQDRNNQIEQETRRRRLMDGSITSLSRVARPAPPTGQGGQTPRTGQSLPRTSSAAR